LILYFLYFLEKRRIFNYVYTEEHLLSKRRATFISSANSIFILVPFDRGLMTCYYKMISGFLQNDFEPSLS